MARLNVIIKICFMTSLSFCHGSFQGVWGCGSGEGHVVSDTKFSKSDVMSIELAKSLLMVVVRRCWCLLFHIVGNIFGH